MQVNPNEIEAVDVTQEYEFVDVIEVDKFRDELVDKGGREWHYRQYVTRTKMKGETKELLDQIVAIADIYMEKGRDMTVRQMFYQLVSRNIIENAESQYRRTVRILTLARDQGYIPWELIVDTARQSHMPPEFEGKLDLVQAALDSYRLERWKDQEYYVEVMLEKSALYGVLKPVTYDYHIRLSPNRGYDSTSEIRNAAQRFIAAAGEDKKCVLLYLGDHDSSGKDMERDLRRRLAKYGADNVHVIMIALTGEQIERYQLPPQAGKTSDPRARGYITKHGRNTWELDALPPDVLVQIVRDAIEGDSVVEGGLIDMEEYNSVIEKEERDKESLQHVVEELEREGESD